MKFNTQKFFLVVGLISLLASCGPASPGPQAWLDSPLDNTTIPLAPLAIQAHASDVDGVTSFEFFVNGETLLLVDVDGSRLSSATIEWTPPSTGRFIIGVRAVDSIENAGHLSTSYVNVSDSLSEAPEAAPIEETDAPANTDTATATETAAHTATSTSTPANIVTLTHTATSTSAPTVTATITSTVYVPPPDTTPPVILTAGVFPESILTESSGCPSYSRTVDVAIVVGDETGMGSVTASWSVGGESGQISLSQADIGYSGTIGPVHTTGDLYITIFAQDTSGNVSQSDTLHVTVQNCIE